MANISIDEERLARNLQRGIGRVDDCLINYFQIPRDYRLRVPVCGLVSLAIANHLTDRGLESSVQISTPELSFDKDFRHVISVANGGDNAMVIDASYSQLLEYVGLNWEYEAKTGLKVYPERKIVAFKFSERDVAVSWLASFADQFRRNIQTDDKRAHLIASPLAEIQAAYGEVWNPENFTIWEPTEATKAAGKKISGYIDVRSVEIS